MTPTIEENRIAAMRVKCRTDSERIVAYLWYVGDWQPTHALRSVETPFGWIGSAGDVRVRELARNDCVDKLKYKVESKPGKALGLDPRFEYFRYWPSTDVRNHVSNMPTTSLISSS
jgi:hypothetical protein